MAVARATTSRICIAGATGLVGRALLARLAADGRAGRITALVRKPGQIATLPKGVRGQTVDFKTLSDAGSPGLPSTDWAFCCLGTTIKQAGSKSAFRAVDFDAVLAFARAAKAAGASRLAVVSALGADPQASVFYNQVKGEMEQALRALDLPHLVIARPSLLLGDRQTLGQPSRPVETLAQWLMPAFGWLMPRRLKPIRADAVAAALLTAVASAATGQQLLESDALQALAGKSGQ
jgi:uncharacterized protein YbjT (DUF2867 family)